MPDPIEVRYEPCNLSSDRIQRMVVSRRLRGNQQRLHDPRQKIIHSEALRAFERIMRFAELEQLPLPEFSCEQAIAPIRLDQGKAEPAPILIEPLEPIERSFHQDQSPVRLQHAVDFEQRPLL